MPDVGAWADLVVDRSGSTATGRLVPDRGAFMNARSKADEAEGHTRHQPVSADDLRRRRNGGLGPGVLNAPGFALTLWHRLPDATWQCFEADGESHANIASADGRWADVTDTSVTYTTSGDLWAAVEAIWGEWNDADRPGIAEYIIRVTSDGETVFDTGHA